jgi:AraC-like DNA-binding protein
MMQNLPASNLETRYAVPDFDTKLRIITENTIRYIEDSADAEGMKSRQFIEQVIRTVAAQIEGDGEKTCVARRANRGGLAHWQERRAKERLMADLAEHPTVNELARECRISVSHFARSFRQTTGMTPHQWLTRHRVEVAKQILRDRNRELSDIALVCGFADQSHFTRVFSRAAGMPPGAWRRRLDE